MFTFKQMKKVLDTTVSAVIVVGAVATAVVVVKKFSKE